jgi:hypothetical protein
MSRSLFYMFVRREKANCCCLRRAAVPSCDGELVRHVFSRRRVFPFATNLAPRHPRGSRIKSPAIRHAMMMTNTANTTGNFGCAVICFGSSLMIGPAGFSASEPPHQTVWRSTIGSSTNKPATVVASRNSQNRFMKG